MHADRRQSIVIERGDATLSGDIRSGEPGHPTVLLLHGLAGHRGEWAGVVHYLPDHFGLIMLDQRGHGESFDGGQTPSQTPSQTDVSAERWVEDAVACIESFVDGPVVLVGQSMGTIVATLLAAARPELIAGLVLIEGGMAAATDDEFGGLADWFDSWPDSFATRREATEFFGVDERSTKAWVDGLAATDGGFGPRFDADTMVATMRALATDDRWAQWKRINAPTVVVQATSSAIADEDIDQMIALRPDVELATVAGGHDLHLDEPEIVAGIIARLAEPSEAL